MEFEGWLRGGIIAAAGVFILAIAGSRDILMLHSLPEIVLGLTIGLAALAIFLRQYLRQRPAVPHLRPLVIVSVLVMLFLNGQQLRAETMLHFFSNYLRVGAVCGNAPPAGESPSNELPASGY